MVAGNHDIALLRRAVRERFTALVLAEAGPAGMREDSIVVHPWILHLPGVLYAEHGSQYHDITRVPGLLGLNGTDDRRPAGPPLISELERYRRDVGERRAGVDRAAALIGVGQESLRFAGALARQALGLSGAELTRQRAAYQALTLRRYADEVGLAHEALVDIDELTAPSAWSIGARLARTWVVGPSARAARAWLFERRRPQRRLWQPADRAAYLRSAWSAVHQILDTAGQPVPFYVFGHTHHPEQLALADGTARYLNAGTWEPFPTSAAPLRGTFVEITGGEPGATRPVARLLQWNDELGQPQPVSLAGGG